MQGNIVISQLKHNNKNATLVRFTKLSNLVFTKTLKNPKVREDGHMRRLTMGVKVVMCSTANGLPLRS